MITALCGGVGGSKLTHGLYRSVPDDELSVVVNTGDDVEFLGLRVCPDLDTVCYTLAGLSPLEQGWGIDGDTFGALSMLERYGLPTWFGIGDRDIATHVYRTHALANGTSLTAVTRNIAHSLGVRANVVPMTEDVVTTRLLVDGAWIEFQEYFVHRRHRVDVAAVRYDGIEHAAATSGALDAVNRAEVVVLVNSNPALSILPILHTPGMLQALQATSAKRVAVSPMVGTQAVSGPAGKLMTLLGHEAQSVGVAALYKESIDGIVISSSDSAQVPEIEALGIAVLCTEIVMKSLEDRVRLAEETLVFAHSL